jgi:DNA mismatch endonuclease (patch repair protein)
MGDMLTPEQRSERMSRIKSRDTKPELALRRALHGLGFRYRLDEKDLPGRPDIVWHRHADCSIATTPKSRTEFWLEKFDRNVARDERSRTKLLALAWRVFIVWECDLKPAKAAKDVAERLARDLRGKA